MELRDLNPANKLPFIKSSNKKIIILLSVVAVLFGVGLYANLYGASKRNSTVQQSETTQAVTPVVTGSMGSTITEDGKKEAPTVLNGFLNLLKQGQIDEANQFVSSYSSIEYFTDLKNNLYNPSQQVLLSTLETKYSESGKFAFVTLEIATVEKKTYYKFVLMKENSGWKAMSAWLL
ncbi:MAG: hypothetical protein UT39_C0005G0044 [Candidatus Woesebacteria bacterium GW2011_GWA1_39_21]|uniref:Uncharacterized protein n=1 Tax=Candidatus Woesebacteria bacterium GW2011_GWA1_39_21 TaxID=1618550 RepID=A0A0G0N607_9BACT|nr:MAG: hypothetical protein UT39_C0005G0044 [Candidatus Woesebacteria bacterium GW2011_GWA1_39_21]